MEKRSETDMRDVVAIVAGPRGWGDTRQSWLARAARRAGVTYRQAKALFYGEITDPKHLAARRMIEEAQRRREEKAARNEYAELRDRIARLEALLVQTDADFHSPHVAGLREQADGLGGEGSAVDCGKGEI